MELWSCRFPSLSSTLAPIKDPESSPSSIPFSVPGRFQVTQTLFPPHKEESGPSCLDQGPHASASLAVLFEQSLLTTTT